jgi:hypothetical protein
MLRRVALARTDVSEELSASFIRVTRIGELGTTLCFSSQRASVLPSSPILVTLMKALGSSETSVLTRATRRNIPEDSILQFLVSLKIACQWLHYFIIVVLTEKFLFICYITLNVVSIMNSRGKEHGTK